MKIICIFLIFWLSVSSIVSKMSKIELRHMIQYKAKVASELENYAVSNSYAIAQNGGQYFPSDQVNLK